MAKGQDKIASSLLDLQPTAVLEFFRIYPDKLNKPTTYLPIHGGSIFENAVYWQNEQYMPVPIESEGFEINSNGQLARPKIRIANKDFLITSMLQNNQDFKNARIIRKRTFLKYLDDINFDGGNPFGGTDYTAEISNEEYIISQKITENKMYVEFELSSPLDLDNFEVTSRTILAKYCYWQYRGCGCNYQGLPIEKEDGNSFVDENGVAVIIKDPGRLGLNSNPNFHWASSKTYSKGDIVYLENKNVIINPATYTDDLPMTLKNWYVCIKNNTDQMPESNPTYWSRDGCSKKISSCSKRFNNAQAVRYKSIEAIKSEDLIRIQGDYSNHNTGKLVSTNIDLIHGFYSDFAIAGWVRNYGSMDGAGILQTSSEKATSWWDDYKSLNLSIEKGNLFASYGLDVGQGDVSVQQKDVIGSLGTSSLNNIVINVKRRNSAKHNYIRWSEKFKSSETVDSKGNQYWANNLCSITNNQISCQPTNSSGSLLTPNAGLSKNMGIEPKYLPETITQDFSLNSVNPNASWATFGQSTTFSCYVKKPTTKPYNYFYFKHLESKDNYDWSEFVVYDLNNITGPNSGIYYNQQVNNPKIIDAGNGWLRISATIYNLNYVSESHRFLKSFSFGPLPGTSYPIFDSGYAPYYDFQANYGDGTSGIYINGAQLEGGGFVKDYLPSTGIGQRNSSFNLNYPDEIEIYLDGVKRKHFVGNPNLMLNLQPNEFSLGVSEWSANKDIKSPNMDFMSWAIWHRSLSDLEISNLSKPVSDAGNSYKIYPRQYEEILNGQDGLSSVINNQLISWWDMQVDPNDSNKIIDVHVDNLYPLTRIGLTTTGEMKYTESEINSMIKYSENSHLHFGGFPGTDNFAYG